MDRGHLAAQFGKQRDEPAILDRGGSLIGHDPRDTDAGGGCVDDGIRGVDRKSRRYLDMVRRSPDTEDPASSLPATPAIPKEGSVPMSRIPTAATIADAPKTPRPLLEAVNKALGTVPRAGLLFHGIGGMGG